MKKRSLLALAALLLCTGLCAQNPMIKAKSIYWWDKDYLTVTWSGTIRPNDKQTVDYICKLAGCPNNGYLFGMTDRATLFGSRVVSIDGIDGKGMSEARFNEIMNQAGPHRLVLSHPSKDQPYEVETLGQIPMWMQAYGFHPAYANWTSADLEMSKNVKVRLDKNAPWRSFKTYDLMILSDDVLADRELLEKVARKYDVMGFVRDTENPDIIITLTKDANKSVEYTYVPETTEHVQTGSTSYAMYGWKGKYLGNFSVNDYKTVKSGGYTQKTSTTTAYLEVSILEASRMGEKTIPMIYQMKYNYNNNSDENVDDLYARAISWIEHPLYDDYSLMRRNSSECHRYFWNDIPLINFGVVVDSQNRVVGLDPQSELVNTCKLQKGDEITLIRSTRHRPISGPSSKITWSGAITVKRNGQSVKLPFKGCHRTNSYKLSFSQIYNVVR